MPHDSGQVFGSGSSRQAWLTQSTRPAVGTCRVRVSGPHRAEQLRNTFAHSHTCTLTHVTWTHNPSTFMQVKHTHTLKHIFILMHTPIYTHTNIHMYRSLTIFTHPKDAHSCTHTFTSTIPQTHTFHTLLYTNMHICTQALTHSLTPIQAQTHSLAPSATRSPCTAGPRGTR